MSPYVTQMVRMVGRVNLVEPMHRSVLLRETIDGIAPPPEGRILDVTVGGGGHAEGLLEAAGSGSRLVGLDRDPDMVAVAREHLVPFGDRVRILHLDMAEASPDTVGWGWGEVDAIVADLGASSPQFDDPERGFSFREPGPLDMRFDRTRGETLGDLLDAVDADTLADWIYHYGEERHSRRVARSILRAREVDELRDTADLARAVRRAIPRGKGRSRIDPATRTFQGLRIVVNKELERIEETLPRLRDFLKPGGRIGVISFHSLEDRIVKRFFLEEDRAGRLERLNRKVIRPDEVERESNPRSRSARLRLAVRRPDPEGG